MPSLFRRSTGDPLADNPATAAASPITTDAPPAVRVKARTPSKKELGKITPKRASTGRRPAEPPPANRREALRRSRQKQRQARAEARAGMMAGKEEYLLPRDKGPERALVRDIVDSRRNVATYFLAGVLVVLLGSSQGMPAMVRFATNIFWIVLAVAVILDSVLLSRTVRNLVRKRFPKDTRRHTWYAVSRSMAFRRMRMPAPRVKPGHRI